MKTKNYFSAIAAIALLASCSNEVAFEAASVSEEQVEIVLTAAAPASVEARSSIESEGANNAFEATDMGFFMFAKGDVAWDPADATDIVWWDNVSGNAVKEGTAPDYTTKMTFSGITDFHKYYPVMSTQAYSFYAYYPRVATMTTASASQRVVSYTIDGSQDIIAGAAICPEATGYNAKYFRQPANQGKPVEMNLNHKLMRFQFNIKAGKNSAGQYTDAMKLTVKSIEIVETPTLCTLIVADRDNAANNGTLTFDWENGLQDLAVKNPNDATFVPVQVKEEMGTTPAKAGQAIMVPVPTTDTYKYKVRVVLTDEDNQEYVSVQDLVATFAAGKSYNVNLTVFGPMEIVITPSLTPWVDSEEIDLEFN